MPFKPLDPPSSEYIPISKDVARFMVGKGAAKVVMFSRIEVVKEKDGSFVKKQTDKEVDVDRMPLYSRRFGDFDPQSELKLQLISDLPNERERSIKELDYDADLDVFYSRDDKGGRWGGVPAFVERPKDYVPAQYTGVAQMHYIPIDFDWGLRSPDASEVLNKVRSYKRADGTIPWNAVNKYDVINTAVNASPTTPMDGTDSIYIWNGITLLTLSDAQDKSMAWGVNPLSIKAIEHVSIGYYDQALPNNSVDWFDMMEKILPSPGSEDRNGKINSNIKMVIMPGLVSGDEGGILLVYQFVFKNQKFRLVSYTSAKADPRDIEIDFANYMDTYQQYQSKASFTKHLQDLATASRSDNQRITLPNSLTDILSKLDDGRTLFMPLSWREMIKVSDREEALKRGKEYVEERDVLDFLKEDDTSDRKRSTSPIGMESAYDGRFFNMLRNFI